MEEYCHTSLPCVNEINLKNFVNKYVILHGKVNSVKNNNLYLSINPEQNTDISVKNFTQNVKVGSTLKIIGRVFPDLSIEYLTHIQLNDDFDLKLLNEVIPIINHKEVSMMFH